MLSIANQCSDEELIRELRHAAEVLVPEFIRRFDGRVQEDKSRGSWDELEEHTGCGTTDQVLDAIKDLERDYSDARDGVVALHDELEAMQSRIKSLESELALIS